MRTLWLIVALLIVIPTVEIVTVIAAAQVIGFGWTVLLMLATSALGGWLLRREGRKAWRALQADIQAGRAPGRPATDGALVVLGGVLMLVPGFASDVFGLLMIMPVTRGLFRGVVERAAVRRMDPRLTGELFGPRVVKVKTGGKAGSEPPIEGEIV